MKVRVFVKPGSSKGPLVVANGDELTVYLRSKAVDGAANAELVKVLAKHLNTTKTSIKITSGASNRHKTIETIR
ncbi:MAG: DUF167 domain-containing protein [Candidatus Nomurabacteria bacterium]|jgi:uncharacterized protein (TIGR00251 family)|nr:DUF167 domain-containing protein [Candidatus Nomurabacteria bacterium]